MFFKNQIKKRIKNEKGLTLIELLAVIVILAIIAAIAIPAIGNIIDNSRTKAVKSDIVNVINAANLYKTENGNLPSELDDLTEDGFIDNPGSVLTVTEFSTATDSNEIIITGTAESKNGTKYTIKDAKISSLEVEKASLGEDIGLDKTTTK